MNKSMLIGRTNGKPVAVKNDTLLFSVAVDEHYNDSKGAHQKRTDWISCQAWGKQAAVLADMITNRSRHISIVGRNRTDSWKDLKTGEMKYRSYILVEAFEILDPKPAAATQPDAFEYNLPF